MLRSFHGGCLRMQPKLVQFSVSGANQICSRARTSNFSVVDDRWRLSRTGPQKCHPVVLYYRRVLRWADIKTIRLSLSSFIFYSYAGIIYDRQRFVLPYCFFSASPHLTPPIYIQTRIHYCISFHYEMSGPATLPSLTGIPANVGHNGHRVRDFWSQKQDSVFSVGRLCFPLACSLWWRWSAGLL
jgi:hypothetical protein